MSLENLEIDRAQLQAVLDDLNSGKLKLHHGQDEFIADLKLRIASLEAKIDGHGLSADGSSADGSLDGDVRLAG